MKKLISARISKSRIGRWMGLREIGTLCAVLLPVIPLQAQTQSKLAEPKITIEIRAMPLEKAAQQLAQVVGTPITVSARLKPLTTYIRVTDVPFSELREKISATFGNYWEKQADGSWFIGKTAATHKKEEDDEVRERTVRVEKLIAKLKSEVAQQPAFTERDALSLAREIESIRTSKQEPQERYKRIEGIDARGPGNRIASRVVAAFPAASLAEIPEDRSVVFCNQPTGMQVKLPFNPQPFLDAYAKEQGIWASAAKGFDFEPKYESGQPYVHLGDLANSTKPVESTPTILMIRVGSFGSNSGIQAEISFGTRTGKKLQGVNFYRMFEQETDAKSGTESEANGPDFKKMKVNISPESRAYTTFMGISKMLASAQMKIERQEPTPAQIKEFLDPATRDPLSYHTSDVLAEISRAEKKNIVCHVSEAFLFLVSPDILPFLTQASTGIKSRTIENWLLFGPSNRVKEARIMYDRTRLRSAMRMIAQGSSTLESDAEYALGEPERAGMDSLSLGILLEAMKVERNLSSMFGSSNETDSLKFFGSLTFEERKRAQSPEGIPLSQLNQSARNRLVRSIFFSQMSRFNIQPDYESAERIDVGEFYGTLKEEPTWFMPQGLPKSAVLKIKDSTDASVRQSMTEFQGFNQEMSLEELASQMFQQSRPDLCPGFDPRGRKLNTDQLVLSQRRQVSMKITLTPGIKIDYSLSKSKPTDGKVYSLQTLPAELKARYMKGLKDAQDSAQHQEPPLVTSSDVGPRVRR